MPSLTNFTPILLIILKTAVMIFMVIYLIFALIVVKQVKIMTETLEVGFEKPMIIISYLHLLFSLIVLVLSLLVL